jgi:glycosyltransferase involved in cell wall biosynthesis
VVGTADDVRRALALEEEPQETGIVALADYMCEIAQLDVGIAPLREDSYTAAKSWLKILEYSAVGVPWVASAMPEYELFHQVAPAGFLAKDRARDWRRGVLQLLQSEALREEFAQAGWEAVRENFLIEENAWRWLEAWEDALVNYHERSAARSGSLSNGNR